MKRTAQSFAPRSCVAAFLLATCAGCSAQGSGERDDPFAFEDEVTQIDPLGGPLSNQPPPKPTFQPMPKWPTTGCWQVLGWSQNNSGATQATLADVDCTTVPETTGWIDVTLYYKNPPSSPLWLRLPLGDPHVMAWNFSPLLVFAGYGPGSIPIVQTDVPVGLSPYSKPILPYPPEQGIPSAGARVRLRHSSTGNCIHNTNQNGSVVHNTRCTNNPAMVYVLDDAGAGLYRLRNESTTKCLYTQNSNGSTAHVWDCWSDPNMRFQLVPASDGYRLQSVSFGQCLYGTPSYGGNVFSWGCWSDPNLTYFVDLL